MGMRTDGKLAKICEARGGNPARLGEWLLVQLNEHGSVMETARVLGISRQTLALYVERYGLCQRWTACR